VKNESKNIFTLEIIYFTLKNEIYF